MSNVAIVTALPALKSHFNDIDNIEFYSRLVLTLPSLVIALLAPFLGHLIAKIGKKKAATIALIQFAISGSAGLYLESINMILLSRAVLGIMIAVLMIVTTSLVGDYFKPEDRPKFMGLQNAFVGLGGILFVVGGGFLSDISWRDTFAIYLISLLILPLAFTQIKEIKIEPSKQDGDIQINKGIYFIYFLAFVYMSLFFILPTQMPFLLIGEFGATGKFTGAIIAATFVANAIGAIIFAKLKGYFSFRTIFLIGLFIFAIGFMGLGLANNLYLFFIPAPIMGFGAGIMLTNLTAWMLSYTSMQNRVKSSGYFTSALFFGQFASPLIFQNIVNHLGIQNFFTNLSLIIATVVFISLIIFSLRNKENLNIQTKQKG